MRGRVPATLEPLTARLDSIAELVREPLEWDLIWSWVRSLPRSWCGQPRVRDELLIGQARGCQTISARHRCWHERFASAKSYGAGITVRAFGR